MENVLKFVMLGIGALVAVVALAVSRRSTDRSELQAVVVAIVGTIVLFLATLPSTPPTFASGLRLGFGILIGGLLGVVAGLLAVRCDTGTPWQRAIAGSGIPSLALFGIGLIFSVFGSYPQPLLGGFLIGAVLSAVVFKLSLPKHRASDLWLLSSIVLGATTLLATYRFDTVMLRVWWIAPAMMLAGVIVSRVVSAGLVREKGRIGLQYAICSALTLALTAIFAWRLFPTWDMLWVSIIAVVTFALVAWLSSLPGKSNGTAVAITLLVLAYSAVAFKFLGGFGIGIGLLASLGILFTRLACENNVLEAELESRHMSVFSNAFCVGVSLLLLRLFVQTYHFDLQGLDFRAYYTFVALALGASLPFIFVSCIDSARLNARIWRMAGLLVFGFTAAALPLLVVILWGMKAALGYLIGAVVSQLMILLLNEDLNDEARSRHMNVCALVAVSLVSATEFTGLLGGLAEGPRLTKVLILAGVLIVAAVWTIIAQFSNRRAVKEA